MDWHHIQVFSLAKNQLTVLPTYIAAFHNLRVFKLDSNPLVWPPPEVWGTGDVLEGDEESIRSWLTTLQSWIATHAAEMQQPSLEAEDGRLVFMDKSFEVVNW